MNNRKFKRLAIIPAKGKSIRIKNKNIKLFFNKPIINYTIDAAKKSKLFYKIHVSTDSEKIKKIVEKKGIKVEFKRPKKLSSNKAPLINVYKYIVKEFKKKGYIFDEVWALMPCSPLINYKDLIKISLFSKKSKTKIPILSTSKYRVPIQWSYKMQPNKVLKPINHKYHNIRSQDLPLRYYETGQFVIYPSKYLDNLKNKSKKVDFLGYVLPSIKSIDIDDVDDWKLAEISYKNLKKNYKSHF